MPGIGTGTDAAPKRGEVWAGGEVCVGRGGLADKLSADWRAALTAAGGDLGCEPVFGAWDGGPAFGVDKIPDMVGVGTGAGWVIPPGNGLLSFTGERC